MGDSLALMAEDEKDAVMAALTRAYWDAKEDNKKYASGKSRAESV